MDEYLAGACSFDEQRRRRLATFLPLVGGDVLDGPADAAWWREYSNDYEAAWEAYDDVIPVFEALAAWRPPLAIGVLTNGDPAQQRAKLAKAGLIEQLDGVFVSTEIGVAKPHPRSFLLACAGLGVRPEETLFVGDWLEVDAIAAAAAGLVGV
jgi:putative hydrolase of the HAD superfamily